VPFATVNEIRMHYEVAGQGDPVLMINGLSAPAVNWAPQVPALGAHFKVVTFDNRGVGETDLAPESIYTTAQMADDAAALLRLLKIPRAHVVGASMGGTIAMELALRHPRLVRSLVLACSWAEADARFVLTIEAWVALAYRVPLEERLRYVLYPTVFSPQFLAQTARVETVFQRAMAYPHPTKPEAIERQARGLLAWNGTRVKHLGAIRVPTLVMVGRDDILTPPAFSKALARRIRRARLSVLGGAHAFFLEEADAFNRTVLRFLKGVRAK
jgi:3-oxoadipate enol-lactonase